jgi:outer membrane protein
MRTALELFVGERFSDIVQNMDDLELLRMFSVDLAMDRLRIRALDKAIEAQEIEIGRLKRRFYLPSLGGMARYERRLEEDRPTPDLPPGFPDIIPEPGPDEWTVALQLTLPLFEGGRRTHELAQAEARLRGMRAELEMLRQTAEEEVRGSLDSLSHSYPNIVLTRRSAEAARRNLEVVSEQYARGALSIIDLLDAQTQAVAQEQAAAVAVYAMVSDLLQYQRSISWMGVVTSDRERADFRQRLERYLSARGSPPEPGGVAHVP